MVKFEDVKNQTTEDYFNNNKFSIDAFIKKYTSDNKESYVEALKRVCEHIASVEKTPELRKYWAERWFDEIYNDWWHPSGSIMQGAGSSKGISLANCTTISMGSIDGKNEWDNLESIIKNTAFTVAKCAAHRQGLGLDASRIRPAKTRINNSANESTGAVHWLKFIDSIGYYVGQKGRIPAMLFSLDIRHPDIEEFIKIKSDYTKIQNANISVQNINDFYKAVEKDDDWELRFEIPSIKKGDKIYVDIHSIDKDCVLETEGLNYKAYYIAKRDRAGEVFTKSVKARYLLELIAKNMHQNAEPGIQNIDIARKYSNSDYLYDENNDYDPRIISTNACSEQYLSRESLCVLASVNAGKFSIDPIEYEKELSIIGPSINRFLDNVNECELKYKTYATPHQKTAIELLRRTGAGYTNLAGWLFKKNLEYGTESGNEAVEHFTERYNYQLYKSSIHLGHEKGSFGLFDREKFERSPFIQRMMGLGLVFDAMRNVTCSSIAPTGTLSLMFRNLVFSYGIEQAFGIYFWKRTRISGNYEYYFCVPKVVRDVFAAHGYNIPIESDAIKDTWDGKFGKPIAKFIDDHKSLVGINFKNASEVKALDKLDMMARVMKWIDSSISVTYMLPEETTWKDVYNFILEAYRREVKSIAAFPDRKMYGIISYIPFKELAIKLTKDGVGIHEQNFTSDEKDHLDKLTNYISKTEKIIPTHSPKRPKELLCDIHTTKIAGKPYTVLIGLLGNDPYEVMVICDHQTKIDAGKILKVKRGEYNLVGLDGKVLYENIVNSCTDNEDSLTRMLSTSLRHGVPIQFLTEQLEKVNGDELHSFARVISRVIKKYIPDGSKVSGSSCPECNGNELIRDAGCVSCACGWSKCL